MQNHKILYTVFYLIEAHSLINTHPPSFPRASLDLSWAFTSDNLSQNDHLGPTRPFLVISGISTDYVIGILFYQNFADFSQALISETTRDISIKSSRYYQWSNISNWYDFGEAVLKCLCLLAESHTVHIHICQYISNHLR